MKNTQITKKYIRYAVSAAEMKRCDETTIEHFGVSQMVLMERAALSLCDFVKKKANPNNKIYIFAGKGNNGGDGIALARLLKQNYFDAELILVGHKNDADDDSKRTGACNKELLSAVRYKVPVRNFEDINYDDIKDASIIVDAILGIGCTRDLAGEYKKACEIINTLRSDKNAYVFAADIPTGVNADTGAICSICVQADETVTFGFKKLGLILYPGCEYAGTVHVENVGITEDGFLEEYPSYKYIYPKGFGIEEIMPERKASGNKGTFGKVLVIAGSKSVSGALIMAMESCLKCGAGMVRAFTDKENLHAVQTMLPEAMYDLYDTDTFLEDLNEKEKVTAKLKMALDWADVIICGPGIGTSKVSAGLLTIVLKNAKKPLVLDADALNIISEDDTIKELVIEYKDAKVMTPHIGEFSRLAGTSISDCKKELLTLPCRLAKLFHASIICKDARTIITDGFNNYINVSGNDGMATAGSGDVLAGIVGAMVAAGYEDLTDTLAKAVFIHGLAGDEAALKNGKRSMSARDITGELATVFGKIYD